MRAPRAWRTIDSSNETREKLGGRERFGGALVEEVEGCSDVEPAQVVMPMMG